LFKRYILNTSYILTSYFVLGYFLFNIDTHVRNYFLIASSVHLAGTIIFHIIPVAYIKNILNIYYIALFSTLYFLTVFNLANGSTDTLVWWIPMLTVISAIYPGKKGVSLAGWSFILALSAFVMAFVLRHVLYHIFYYNTFFFNKKNTISHKLHEYITGWMKSVIFDAEDGIEMPVTRFLNNLPISHLCKYSNNSSYTTHLSSISCTISSSCRCI
jgi:hypothetical protein